ncbi:MAG: MFS transporter [Acidobacteria bacterium]|nr:MAG: MFS transporter [Acidobacteriota bacterium]
MQQFDACRQTTGKVGFLEKIGYGLGDGASCFYFQTFSAYLLFFYTDVYGLPAAIVGTMLAVTRIGDAIIDPFMGMVADRTRSRWGHFRPYLIWMSLPLAVMGVATFTTPGFGLAGKIIYAYVTYSILMLLYTAINIPYGALLGVVSSDSLDRTSLASYKMSFAFGGSLVVQAVALYLVEFFGGGNAQRGWQLTMAAFGVIAVILFFGTFSLTRERIQPPVQQRTTFSRDFADLITNVPWLLLCVIGVSTLVYASLRVAATVYYFKYYIGPQTFSFLGQSYELDTKGFMAVFTVLGYAGSILGVMSTRYFVKYLGKKYTYLFSMAAITLVTASYFLYTPKQLTLIFAMQFVGLYLNGPSMAVIWAMYADIADYSEWKHRRRATGLVFSASCMSQKMGWAFGGAVAGWLLAYYGFVAGEVQSVSTQTGIVTLFSLIPAVPALLATLLILFYSLDEKRMQSIQEELTARRAGEEAGQPVAVN